MTQSQCEAFGLTCKEHLGPHFAAMGIDVGKIDWSKFMSLFMSLLPLILALFPAPGPTPGPLPIPVPPAPTPTPAGAKRKR